MALIPKFGYYMPWYMFGDAMILIGSSLMGCKYLRDARCNLERQLIRKVTVDGSSSKSRIYGYIVLIKRRNRLLLARGNRRGRSQGSSLQGEQCRGLHDTCCVLPIGQPVKRLALLTWRPDSTNAESNRNSQRGRFFVPEHWH